MMFRRRTTDQVYATLQQVQRRITEQGSAVPPSVRPAGPVVGTGPATVPATTPAMPPASIGTAPSGAAVDHISTPRPPALPAPGTIPMPVSMAATLVLVWLVSLAGSYALGLRQGRSDAPVPVSSPPVRQTGDAEPISGRRLGNAIYVLRNEPRFTPEMKQQWQTEADRLNGFMRKNEARGWKPYFAVREPENGGLQFVFGYANGQFGIERTTAFEDLARLLASPTTKGGGGYTQAKWLTLD